jgi:carbon monoxide dehydrogenase subunit G
MKWVVRLIGGVVGFALILVMGLWLVGLRPGHGHNEVSVQIARPAEKVWPWLTEDAKLKQWIHGLTEIRSVTPEVQGVGERLRVVMVLGNERTEAEMRMTEFEKHRKMGFAMESVGDPSNGFRSTVLYTIEESGGMTRVTLKEDSTYFGFLPRLFEPVITPSAQKLLEENLQNLKRLVEAEAH